MLIAQGVAFARKVRGALGHDEDGATAVEYGVMVALIIAVIIVVVMNVGQELVPGYETVNSALGS